MKNTKQRHIRGGNSRKPLVSVTASREARGKRKDSPLAFSAAPANSKTKQRRQVKKEAEASTKVTLQFAGPSPSEPVFDLNDESTTQWVDEFDDHTGAQLARDLARGGKMEKIRWVNEIGLNKKIRRAEAKRRGITVVPIRWVVTDKGDPNRPKVRRRLVGRELRSRTKGTLLAHDLFQCNAPVGSL